MSPMVWAVMKEWDTEDGTGWVHLYLRLDVTFQGNGQKNNGQDAGGASIAFLRCSHPAQPQKSSFSAHV